MVDEGFLKFAYQDLPREVQKKLKQLSVPSWVFDAVAVAHCGSGAMTESHIENSDTTVNHNAAATSTTRASEAVAQGHFDISASPAAQLSTAQARSLPPPLLSGGSCHVEDNASRCVQAFGSQSERVALSSTALDLGIGSAQGPVHTLSALQLWQGSALVEDAFGEDESCFHGEKV